MQFFVSVKNRTTCSMIFWRTVSRTRLRSAVGEFKVRKKIFSAEGWEVGGLDIRGHYVY